MKLPSKAMAIITVIFVLVLLGTFMYRNHPGSMLNQPIPSNSIRDPYSGRIDLNTADLEELMFLPGIGETLARRILDYRELHGKFRSVNDLYKIKGFGKSRIDEIRDFVTIGG